VQSSLFCEKTAAALLLSSIPVTVVSNPGFCFYGLLAAVSTLVTGFVPAPGPAGTFVFC